MRKEIDPLVTWALFAATSAVVALGPAILVIWACVHFIRKTSTRLKPQE